MTISANQEAYYYRAGRSTRAFRAGHHNAHHVPSRQPVLPSTPLRWHIGASGIEGLILEAGHGDREVAPGEVASVPVRLDAPAGALRAASTPVRFTIEAVGAGDIDIRASEEARFLGPAGDGDS